MNDALKAVADRVPGRVTFVPWADAICPGGRYVPEDRRHHRSARRCSRGQHPGAQLITDRIVPILSRLAREARDAREARPSGDIGK